MAGRGVDSGKENMGVFGNLEEEDKVMLDDDYGCSIGDLWEDNLYENPVDDICVHNFGDNSNCFNL